MPNSIVLMTALVPTVGHKYLIDFAKNLLGWNDKVYVLLGTMDREPVAGELRFNALVEEYQHDRSVVLHRLHGDLPQQPSEHSDFWNVWRDVVRTFVEVEPDDYIVASELYGMDMARVLGCKFMPCNRYRETISISGTEVRNNLIGNFKYILPSFQQYIRRTVTVFGAESCGKTTMTRWLAENLGGHFVPEWAREYLETVGAEITDEKMRTIVHGQYALQHTAQLSLKNKPLIFQDTDLLSTVGYYRIWGGGTDRDLDYVEHRARHAKSDFYIVMNDHIPFEADPLRYGGTVRESKTQFWVDLLEEFGCKYHVVESTELGLQRLEVSVALQKFWDSEMKPIKDYVR